MNARVVRGTIGHDHGEGLWSHPVRRTVMGVEQDVLRTYRTIAVVGLNSDPDRPSHWVSDYMRHQGYRIIPVNPDETEVFGQKAYPDLQSVPEPVDFVDVFRRPQFCAEI